jgi:hypothetical protein
MLSVGPFAQSVDNAIAGVVTTTSSSASLANSDGEIDEHLSDDKNFSVATVWFVVNDQVNTVFTGHVEGVNASSKVLNLSLVGADSVLSGPCLMGDSYEDATVKTSYTTPATFTDHVGLPIKYLAGTASYSKWRKASSGSSPVFYAPLDFETAHCRSYTATPSTSVNRQWILCRTHTNSFKSQSIGSLTAEYTPGSGFWYLNFSSHDLMVGDWVLYTSGGVDHYCWVREVINNGTSLSPGLTFYNVLVIDTHTAAFTPSTSTLTQLSVPTVVILAEGNYYPVTPFYYSTTFDATAAGNYIARITFSNNIGFSPTIYGVQFEADVGPLDPANHQVLWFARGSGSQYHGDTIQRILEAGGIDVDAASVSSANAAVPLRAAMTIPSAGSQDFGSYRDYLGQLSGSVGAYMAPNPAGEFEYSVLSAPAAGIEIGYGEIISGSLSIYTESIDVHARIKATNPHIATPDAILGSDAGVTQTANVKSNYERVTNLTSYLYPKASTNLELSHSLEYIHDTDDDSNGRLAYLASVYSKPIRKYQFSVSSALLEHSVGDDVTLVCDEVPGGSVNVKIISLEKSLSITNVVAVEFP